MHLNGLIEINLAKLRYYLWRKVSNAPNFCLLILHPLLPIVFSKIAISNMYLH